MAFVDPDESSQASASPSNGGGGFVDPDESKPQATTGRSAASVGVEAGVRGLPATGGFWAGAGTGAAAVSPAAEFALAAGGPAGPLVAGAIEVTGGLIGGVVGSMGVEWAVNKLNAVIDPEGYKRWEQAQQEHPGAAMAGSMVSGFAGSSPKTAAVEAGKWWTNKMAQRGISGAAMGTFDAGQQYVTTGKVDPLAVAASTVGGAALPGANAAGKFAHALGEVPTKAIMGKSEPTVDTIPQRPSKESSPEEKKQYIDTLKQEIKKRNEYATLGAAYIGEALEGHH